MTWKVYILKCHNDSYYVGLTSDLKHRILEHSQGECHHTKSRLPVLLVYSEAYDNKLQAARRERQLKGWTRIKKEKLIKGFWKKTA